MEKHYTVKEVAEIVGVSQRTVCSWWKIGKVKAVNARRGLRISQTELNRILEGGIETPSLQEGDKGAAEQMAPG